MEMIKEYYLWFMLYSVTGWVYETILCSVTEHRFVNRGFLNGPYCPIYGVGAVINLLALGQISNPILLFLCGAVLDCTLEYITSWGMEKLFHARWWDYSDRPLNIHGRVCILGALAFGSFSVVLVLVLHPFLTDKLSFITGTVRDVLFWVLLAVFLADSIYTLIGFSPFNKLLGHIVTPSQSGVFHADGQSDDIDKLRSMLTSQIRRMLRAFPALKSTRYDAVVEKLRARIAELEKLRKQYTHKGKKDN